MDSWSRFGCIIFLAITGAVAQVLMALPANGADFVCDDSFQGITIEANVIVPPDAECDLRDSVVTGDVQLVHGGHSPLIFATLSLRNTEIHGDIKHNAADIVDISEDSVIHGSVLNLFNHHAVAVDGHTSIEDSTILGDLITVRTERVDIDNSHVGGNVKIENPATSLTFDRVRIDESTIGGTVDLKNNSDIRVADNHIGCDLLCENNQSVDIQGNTVVGIVDCDDVVDTSGPGCSPEPDIPGDLNGDGVVNVFDVLVLLAEWGPCADPLNCPADLDSDGIVNVFDLLLLLANWG